MSYSFQQDACRPKKSQMRYLHFQEELNHCIKPTFNQELIHSSLVKDLWSCSSALRLMLVFPWKYNNQKNSKMYSCKVSLLFQRNRNEQQNSGLAQALPAHVTADQSDARTCGLCVIRENGTKKLCKNFHLPHCDWSWLFLPKMWPSLSHATPDWHAPLLVYGVLQLIN